VKLDKFKTSSASSLDNRQIHKIKLANSTHHASLFQILCLCQFELCSHFIRKLPNIIVFRHVLQASSINTAIIPQVVRCVDSISQPIPHHIPRRIKHIDREVRVSIIQHTRIPFPLAFFIFIPPLRRKIIMEQDPSTPRRVNRKVFGEDDADARVPFSSTLFNEDHAVVDRLAVGFFDSEIFGVGISTVIGGSWGKG
jgi:hypothetical protein